MKIFKAKNQNTFDDNNISQYDMAVQRYLENVKKINHTSLTILIIGILLILGYTTYLLLTSDFGANESVYMNWTVAILILLIGFLFHLTFWLVRFKMCGFLKGSLFGTIISLIISSLFTEISIFVVSFLLGLGGYIVWSILRFLLQCAISKQIGFIIVFILSYIIGNILTGIRRIEEIEKRPNEH